MTFGNKVRAVITTTVLSAAAMSALAGCQFGDDEEVYCVDKDNKVVDDDLCDENGNVSGGGGYFFFVGNLGGNSYRPGQRIPSSYISSGKRVAPSNTKARTSAGLPAKGKVSSGTRISGGIGTGSVKGSGGG